MEWLAQVDWTKMTVGVTALVMMTVVSITAFRFMGNHSNHLTDAIEKLAEAITALRIHCATVLEREEDRRE